MNIKLVALAAVASVAVVPVAGASPSPSNAFNACVNAFVKTYLPAHTIRATKTTNSPSPHSLALSPRKYTIALSARGADSGEVLANARCVADSNGIVLILDTPASLDYVARADFRTALR